MKLFILPLAFILTADVPLVFVHPCMLGLVQCDDHDPCTSNVCTKSGCTYPALPGGTPCTDGSCTGTCFPPYTAPDGTVYPGDCDCLGSDDADELSPERCASRLL